MPIWKMPLTWAQAPAFGLFEARWVDYSIAEEAVDDFTANIAQGTPYIPVFTAQEDPANSSLISGAQTLGNTLGFLALVSLIVSGFLVINVINAIVVEQKRQIGVMKSLGATRLDSFFIYSGIAFAYGLIGVIPGVIVGIPVGNAIAHTIAPEVNTVLEGFQISPGSIFLGVLVGLLVPVLASILPVFNGTRVRILEALTDLGIDANYGTGPLARIIGILPVPITVRQGLSNVTIKKGRILFTMITLSIAVGAFIGIFAVFNSLTTGLGLFFDSFNVEVGVFPNETVDPAIVIAILEREFVNNPARDFSLESIEPGFQQQVEFEGYDPLPSAGGPPGIFAYGYQIESDTPAFNFEVTEGTALTPENAEAGIIFSSLLASNMDKGVGDRVVIQISGNERELEVVGIADFPLDQVWMDWRTLADISGYRSGAPRANEYLTEVAVEGLATAQNGTVNALGIDQQFAGFLDDSLTEGEFSASGTNGVVISEALAEAGGYAVGDRLSLSATTENGTQGEYPVVGILAVPPAMAAQMGDLPAEFIMLNLPALVELEGATGEGVVVPQGYFLTTTIDDPSAEELDDVLNDLNEAMLDNGIPSLTFNFVELVDQISVAFTTFQVIMQLVAALIAVVGALGLLTTLSMSVFERQKEIGVMRSIGAGSSTVAMQFLTEGLVVGFIAWVVGLPLGFLIQILLLSITGFDETFPVTFPIEGAILALVGVMVITTLASLLPSLSAARKTVSDILRYQ
ncbi:MAG: FtsX-like permease family protein [Anaerolineae bacterium]|nr:FtsX-like permease family protein [Anaerolineae bacterium]